MLSDGSGRVGGIRLGASVRVVIAGAVGVVSGVVIARIRVGSRVVIVPVVRVVLVAVGVVCVVIRVGARCIGGTGVVCVAVRGVAVIVGVLVLRVVLVVIRVVLVKVVIRVVDGVCPIRSVFARAHPFVSIRKLPGGVGLELRRFGCGGELHAIEPAEQAVHEAREDGACGRVGVTDGAAQVYGGLCAVAAPDRHGDLRRVSTEPKVTIVL